MTNTDYARFSDNAIMFAAVVLCLALLAHIIEWALQRQPAATSSATNTRGSRSAIVRPVAVSSGSESPGIDLARHRRPRHPRPDDRAADRVELAGRIGIALTTVGFALNVAGVVTRALASDRVPWGNMYEFTIMGCAATLATYLTVLRFQPIRWLGLSVTALVVVLLMAAVLLLNIPAGPLVPALHSYWLYIHVTAALVATGTFAVGMLASLLYLIKDRAEAKGAAHQGIGARLPHSETIDLFAYRIHAFGFPVWTFAALIAGPIWARFAWGRYWGWDPKEVWAFITWVAYAAYLHARATAGWRGRRAALLALVGFAALLFNFVGINLWGGGLHSYAGK